jgi:ATP-dependent Clp protease ATP-binding subunit ClpC
MFEKFTEGSIKVIMMAQEEGRRMGHNFVGTEQLLLGLVAQRHGIAARALRRLKVSLKNTRKEVQLYIGRGNGFISPDIPFTPRAKRVLEMAVAEGKDLGQNYVGTEHLLLALLTERDGVAMRTLDKMNVDVRRLKNLVYDAIEESQEEILRPLSQTERYLLERERDVSPTPTLDEYSENISQEAARGQLDPVIGREDEINNLIAVLARRTKNNPVLVGEPGVGKTAVAEGLAQIILKETGPDFLDGNIVISLDLGSVLAGTKYRGEFEDRLKRILDEIQRTPRIIIVIDEIHTLVGAGAAEGAVDAANMLKPPLARGKFRCIGATTKDEYRKYIERDTALERRFQPVSVDEPHVGTAIEILRGLKSKFEVHHGLTYVRESVEQAVILADKYIADRFLPDKAIDVLDETGARVRLENRRLPEALQVLIQQLKDTIKTKEKYVKENKFKKATEYLDMEMETRSHVRIVKSATLVNKTQGFIREDVDLVLPDDVANVVSSWTGIPVNKITGSESERLLQMEELLHNRIIGQNQAVIAVSNAVRRARVGLRNPDRPIASFIFAGPTGVGKTELTKALTDFLFDSKDSFIRLDMSEYMEKHTVAKLIGSPPGYVGYNEGGILTESVRSKPYSVVLFDEVEKAHPDVFNLLLQILDDGRLSDSKGKVIDFTNTVIVMTTNLGAKTIEEQSGIKNLVAKEDDAELKLVVNDNKYNSWKPNQENEQETRLIKKTGELVKDELKNFFRPEFLNRIDEIVVFNHLTKHDVWEISRLMLDQLVKRISDKNIKLVISEEVRSLLVDEGYDPLYGARPLRRTIMHYLEDKLAEKCLSTEFKPGTTIVIKRKDLKTFKKDFENDNNLNKLVQLMDNASVRLLSDKYGENIKSLIKVGYYGKNFKFDVDIIDSMYQNPFGYTDEETFTNYLDIEVKEKEERKFLTDS